MKLRLLGMVAAAGLLASSAAYANQTLADSAACTACHGVDKKVVGPAYKDVAKKYAGQADAEAKLFDKIKKGGSGVWGPVPMPPNVAIKDDDIKTLVKWILSMK